MSKSNRREVESRLKILLVHLLKWQYQPEQRIYGYSWQHTIREQRQQLALALDEHPSLRAPFLALLPARYAAARAKALDETGLADTVLPLACPWTPTQLLDDDFWPED